MKTELGEFNSSKDYRNHLEKLGYKNLGWMNSWSAVDIQKYREETADNGKEESIKWNRDGYDTMYVYHVKKVFCSVDTSD